jgi:hypothetical protein
MAFRFSSIDNRVWTRLIADMIRALACLAVWLCVAPAAAMVGGAPAAGTSSLAAQVVMIVGSRGSFCTGTAIARDLVLTAAHCVPAGAEYKLVEFDAAHQPGLKAVAHIAHHPDFTWRGLKSNRGTADLALLKLAAPMHTATRIARLADGGGAIHIGDRFIVIGYGITHPGNARSGGTLRAATLVATGRPDSMDVRLTDPATNNHRAGLGACTGDSGAPVFAHDGAADVVVGVVGWTMGPNNSAGCGGITGVTPIARYRGWIVATARKWGNDIR